MVCSNHYGASYSYKNNKLYAVCTYTNIYILLEFTYVHYVQQYRQLGTDFATEWPMQTPSRQLEQQSYKKHTCFKNIFIGYPNLLDNHMVGFARKQAIFYVIIPKNMRKSIMYYFFCLYRIEQFVIFLNQNLGLSLSD